jgi:peptide/nickel transport system substrate-binding protein
LLKRFSVLVIVLLLGMALISCGTGDTGDNNNEGTVDNTLRIAIGPPSGLDPSFASTPGDYVSLRLWNEFLVFIDEEGQPDVNRSLAEKWEVDETGTVWTFKLREGVLFHDGKEMTSKDVKFTFDRLRDPEIGATTVSLYSNIKDITTPDEYTVVFELEKINPVFLLDLAEEQAHILDADNPDFNTNHNGLGPFMVEKYIPEDRMILTRNPNYWRKDAEGNSLPYLDRVELIVTTDVSAQVEALRGGQLDFIYNLPVEYWSILEEDPNLEIYTKPGNTHHVIRMRSDVPPFDNVLVRQALKLGTDYDAIVKVAYEGNAVTGRNTPVGPGYGDYYLDVPKIERDVEKAKQLLAEAGYADGLNLTLVSEDSPPNSTIAVLWKEQMQEIGVNVDIQLTSTENYYNDWLNLDLGITSWGARSHPMLYLQLAYVTGAPWNETHWSDSELDKLVNELATELDHDQRVRLYHEIQEIFMERAPVIIPAFRNSSWVANKNLQGIKPHYNQEAIDLTELRFVK